MKQISSQRLGSSRVIGSGRAVQPGLSTWYQIIERIHNNRPEYKDHAVIRNRTVPCERPDWSYRTVFSYSTSAILHTAASSCWIKAEDLANSKNSKNLCALLAMRHQPLVIHVLILLCFYIRFTGSLVSSHQDRKALKVGEELWKETLPMQMGSALYELLGLEPFKWYEVKISYPASIPASFSLQLKRDASELGLHRGRKLLNTEKLIFQYDNPKIEGSIYVLVTVMPEGVVAIPDVKEREFIIFNIVCDELLLGIPGKAWWAGALVLLCMALAVIVPRYLPPFYCRAILPPPNNKPARDLEFLPLFCQYFMSFKSVFLGFLQQMYEKSATS